MTFLPIVERELRVRARWRSTFRIRVGAAGLGFLVVSALLVLSQSLFSPSQAGTIMFNLLGGLAFLGCLLEGLRTTADCLSGEKRAGTLGLLFLTDLSGYDVVLGKWLASSLDSTYSLLAVLPSLAMPIILGGITGGEFWRLTLVLINTLWFSLAVGILVSILSYEERQAWLATLLCVGLPAVVPLLVPGGLSGALDPWLLPCPTVAFHRLFESVYSYTPQLFWQSLLSLHAMIWICLGLASLLSPRLWREPVQRERGGLFRRTSGWDGGKPCGARPQQGPRRVSWEPDPVASLVERMAGPVRVLWVLIGLVVLMGVIWWVMLGLSEHVGGVLLLIALGVHLIIAGMMAARACHVATLARDSGMLEMLLGTPLTVAQVVGGLHAGLWRGVAPPVAALAGVEFVLLTAQCIALGYKEPHFVSSGLSFLFFGVLLGASLLDVLAVSYFGLWMGLTTRRSSQALARTVLYVLVLPWVAAPCCTVLWPALALAKNYAFILFARGHLQHLPGRMRTRAGEEWSPLSHDSLPAPSPGP